MPRGLLVLAVVSSLVSPAIVAAQSGGGYLDALEGEAEQLDDTDDGRGAARNLGGIPEGLDMTGFEAAMKKKFFGSFLFYSKLSDEKKSEAYAAYQRDSRIEPIRRKIMDLFSNR